MIPQHLRRGHVAWILALSLQALLVRAQTPTPAASGSPIRGHVLDSISRRPISLARVSIRGTTRSVATSIDGRFAIPGVPAGSHVLEVRRLGFLPVEREDVVVGVDSGAYVTVVMSPVGQRLADVTVTPGSFALMESGTSNRQAMSRVDIEAAPQLAEDIFRAVNRLPGLTSGDYSAHFSIRGGRHDETLILLDGLELFEPYHLKDFNEGAISIIDVETIEGVELMTGGFPAKFGDKRSGVFSMSTRQPKDPARRFSVGASLLNARVNGEGTFSGGKGSWLVSGRRGYMDLLLSFVKSNDLPSPSYYDVFGALRYNVHQNHSLGLNVLRSGDKYTFNANANAGFLDTIDTREIASNGYGNSYVWLTARSLLGPRVTARTMLSASRVTARRGGTELYLNIPGAMYDFANQRNFTVLGLKQDVTYEHSDAVMLELGYDFRRLSADYALDNIVYQRPDDASEDTTAFYPQETTSALARTGTTLGAYVSTRLRPFSPLILEIGSRYDRANYTGDNDLSPRVNALLRLSESNTLRAGWGHYRQRQSIADFAVLDGLGRYFPSELSRQWTLGLEHSLGDDGLLRVEGYHKKGSNLRPVYRGWKGGLDVFPETNEDWILVYPEASTSKGIEVYHTRDFRRGISIRGSYAFAIVTERAQRIDNVNIPTPLVFDVEHPAPQDQRHSMNLDLAYRPKGKWSAQASYAFHSGWPATLESLRAFQTPAGGTDYVVRPDTLYGSRLTSYHRLDLRLTRRVTTSNGSFRFFFEVNNLTNHKNLFGYDYNRELDGQGRIVLLRDPEVGFPILPSVGIAWTRTF